MENYGKLDRITQLVDDAHLLRRSTVNQPDGRDYFMHGAAPGARTGHVTVDEDNGLPVRRGRSGGSQRNGVIEQFANMSPVRARHRKSSVDPRIMEPRQARRGGRLHPSGAGGRGSRRRRPRGEDGPGGYDPNRNFASDWQPNYVQRGAMDYPFQLPESKAVNDFLLAHPNVAGLQTYHNSGGMILRSPVPSRLGNTRRPTSAPTMSWEKTANACSLLPLSGALERSLHHPRGRPGLDQ